MSITHYEFDNANLSGDKEPVVPPNTPTQINKLSANETNNFRDKLNEVIDNVNILDPSSDNFVLKDPSPDSDQSIYGGLSVGGDYNENPLTGDLPPVIHVVNPDGSLQPMRVSTYNNSDGLTTISLEKYRGTPVTPTAILLNDIIYSIASRGYNGTSISSSSTAIYAQATENFTPIANGTKLVFETTNNGTFDNRIKALTLENDGTTIIHQNGIAEKYLSVGGIHNLRPNPGEGPHVFDILNNDTSGAQNTFQFTVYSNTGGHTNWHSRLARGTKDAPSAVLSGDYLVSMGFRGHNGSDFAGSSAAIQAITTEPFTETANGTMLRFQVMPNGASGAGRVTPLDLTADTGAIMNLGALINKDGLALKIQKATNSGNSFVRFYDETGTPKTYLGIFGTSNAFNVDAVEQINITSGTGVFFDGSGNVVIGASTDTGAAKLQVTGKITASVAPTNPTDVVRLAELEAVRPYKVYTAFISQSGTSAPTVTVLENTLGGAISWAYTGVGIYTGTLSGVFTLSKTWVHTNLGNSSVVDGIVRGVHVDLNTVIVNTYNTSAVGSDNILNANGLLEIRVYN
jgi:hypothetical protein